MLYFQINVLGFSAGFLEMVQLCGYLSGFVGEWNGQQQGEKKGPLAGGGRRATQPQVCCMMLLGHAIFCQNSCVADKVKQPCCCAAPHPSWRSDL